MFRRSRSLVPVVLATLVVTSPAARSAPAASQGYPFGEWSVLTTTPRREQAATYDPLRDRLVVYGGQDGQGYRDDAASLSLAVGGRWSLLAPSASVGAAGASMVYDALRDRMLVLGGYEEFLSDGPRGGRVRVSFSQLRALDLATGRWVPLASAGTSGWNQAAAYDAARDRMLVFGGKTILYNAGTVPLSALWEYVPGRDPAWSQLPQSGDPPPPGVEGSAMIDSVEDRMLLVAGDTTWALPLALPYAWRRLESVGPAPAGAGPTVLDRLGRRLVAQRGPSTWVTALEDTLRWSLVSAEAPSFVAEGGESAIWRDQDGSLIVFGGGWSCPSGKAWRLALDTPSPSWTQVEDGQPALAAHQAIFDPVRNRILAMGGSLDQVYSFDPADPGTWSPVETTGDGPGSRLWASAVYDPVADRVVAFGGRLDWYGLLPSDSVTWGLSLASTPPAWVRLTDRGEVAHRAGVSAVYDPIQRRILAFGGGHDDVWEFRESTGWNLVPTQGTSPGPQSSAAAVFDSTRNRLLVFGLLDSMGNSALWALDLTGMPTWRLLVSPAPREAGILDYPTVLLDPVRDRLVLIRGRFVWTADLANPRWDASVFWDLAPGGERVLESAVYDPIRDAVFVTGGLVSSCGPSSEVWALTWGTPLCRLVIDLKPGDPANQLLRGQGDTTSVVLLGNPKFDAMTIDRASLVLSGAPVLRTGAAPWVETRDANGDGILDLEAHFAVDATTLTPSDTVARIEGRAGPFVVRGYDRVRVIQTVPIEPPPPTPEPIELAILGWRRGLADLGLRVTVSLPVVSRARLDVFDIRGRRLGAGDVLPRRVGAIEVDLGEGRLSAGIYLLRLSQGARALTRKIALTH